MIGYLHYDRDLPLKVPGVRGETYDSAIRRLVNGDILIYPQKHILVGLLGRAPARASEDSTIVELGYGCWLQNRLERPFRLRLDTANWSVAKRQYVFKELEIARQEARESVAAGNRKEKSWVFFLLAVRTKC